MIFLFRAFDLIKNPPELTGWLPLRTSLFPSSSARASVQSPSHQILALIAHVRTAETPVMQPMLPLRLCSSPSQCFIPRALRLVPYASRLERLDFHQPLYPSGSCHWPFWELLYFMKNMVSVVCHFIPRVLGSLHGCMSQTHVEHKGFSKIEAFTRVIFFL